MASEELASKLIRARRRSRDPSSFERPSVVLTKSAPGNVWDHYRVPGSEIDSPNEGESSPTLAWLRERDYVTDMLAQSGGDEAAIEDVPPMSHDRFRVGEAQIRNTNLAGFAEVQVQDDETCSAWQETVLSQEGDATEVISSSSDFSPRNLKQPHLKDNCSYCQDPHSSEVSIAGLGKTLPAASAAADGELEVGGSNSELQPRSRGSPRIKHAVDADAAAPVCAQRLDVLSCGRSTREVCYPFDFPSDAGLRKEACDSGCGFSTSGSEASPKRQALGCSSPQLRHEWFSTSASEAWPKRQIPGCSSPLGHEGFSTSSEASPKRLSLDCDSPDLATEEPMSSPQELIDGQDLEFFGSVANDGQSSSSDSGQSGLNDQAEACRGKNDARRGELDSGEKRRSPFSLLSSSQGLSKTSILAGFKPPPRSRRASAPSRPEAACSNTGQRRRSLPNSTTSKIPSLPIRPPWVGSGSNPYSAERAREESYRLLVEKEAAKARAARLSRKSLGSKPSKEKPPRTNKGVS